MASKVTQYLSEELGEGAGSSGASDADTAAARRRTLLAALGQRGADLLGLQLQSVSHYLQQGMQQAAAAATAQAAASQRAIGAALNAIASLVAWLPMKVLRGSVLVDACATLLQTEDFKGAIVEILLQVCRWLRCGC